MDNGLARIPGDQGAGYLSREKRLWSWREGAQPRHSEGVGTIGIGDRVVLSVKEKVSDITLGFLMGKLGGV